MKKTYEKIFWKIIWSIFEEVELNLKGVFSFQSNISQNVAFVYAKIPSPGPHYYHFNIGVVWYKVDLTHQISGNDQPWVYGKIPAEWIMDQSAESLYKY